MRRIRLRTGPAALFGAMLVVALIVFLPMRLVLGLAGLGEEGLSARRVGGTIWGASLTEARFGEMALGDLDARLSPWPLLIGQARIVLTSRGGGDRPLDGALTLSRHGFGIDDMTARIATGRMFAPLPVATLDLDAVTIHIRDGQCDAAEGRVRATLTGDFAGVALPPVVAGSPRCEGGAVLLPLTSQAGSESIALRIQPAGTYRAELTMTPADPLFAQKLEAAGFVAQGGAYRLSVEGRF
jgi:general secretion pathway protein N